MKKLFKIIAVLMIVLIGLTLTAAGLFVGLVGPWPVYKDAGYRQARYFQQALDAIEASARDIPFSESSAALQAGWAEYEITPQPGHPMAGYGGRADGLRSTGVHEPLFVRALALSDGKGVMVLVGSDMLQTFPNLLEEVEKRIEPSGLTNRNVYYTSSHTHCGPGGLAPGLVAETFMGAYEPAYLTFLADQFSKAILQAIVSLKPAQFAHGMTDVPEFIRNRSRKDAPADSRLHVACVEWKEDGRRLYLARYSAHGTTYSEEMRKFNNDYAGAFQRAVREKTGMPLLFMGGAVGSMRPYPPGPPMPQPWNRELELGFENDVESRLVREGKKTLESMLSDQEARVEGMGQALAERLLTVLAQPAFTAQVRLQSIVVSYAPPPAQVRPVSTQWRLSPFAFTLLGVPKRGRLQAFAVNDCLFTGMPYDFSGEISLKWQAQAKDRNLSLWTTSFSGAYLGYLSPDRYYYDMGDHFSYNNNYEIGQMNWFGPNQEAFATDLFGKVLDTLFPGKT